jgi:hypothetical protein
VLERPDAARRKAVAVPRLVNWLEAQEPLRGDNVPQGLMSFLAAPERETRGGGALLEIPLLQEELSEAPGGDDHGGGAEGG